MLENTPGMKFSAVDVARTGAEYLGGLVKPNGQFVYQLDHQTGEVGPGYNVLRHCGTIWAMLDVYRMIGCSEQTLQAARRAGGYLLDQYLRFDHDIDAICISEDNSIKLGGNGLAILALLSLSEVTGDQYILHTAIRLGEYIVANRTADGDFIHKKFFKSQKISAFRSDYYTGEALLALLALFEKTKDVKWLEVAKERETELAKVDYGVSEQSHWMLYALEVISRHHKTKEYFSHAAKIARHILDYPEYRASERSTPIACRSEGLLAFLRMTREGGVDSNLREACLAAIREDLSLQFEYRRPDGAFVRGGDKDKRAEEMRIDYVQHNISGFLYYHLDGHSDAASQEK